MKAPDMTEAWCRLMEDAADMAEAGTLVDGNPPPSHEAADAANLQFFTEVIAVIDRRSGDDEAMRGMLLGLFGHMAMVTGKAFILTGRKIVDSGKKHLLSAAPAAGEA
jgi:hypothetical protein